MEGSSIQADAAAPYHDMENLYVQLETSMKKRLDILSPVSPLCCIFRVPHRLIMNEREKAVHYTPQLISIGPLHHGKPALKAMEEHKNRYLQHFLGRTNNLSLKDCIKKIKDQEAILRSCYSETIDLESDEFVRIILVDAIFVIEFLFRYRYPELVDVNDCIFGKPIIANDIWTDLLMLENQLPFFILEELFYPHIFLVPSTYSHGVERISILFLSHYFLHRYVGFHFEGMLDNLETIHSSGAPIQHFVDLSRKLCTSSIVKKQSECPGQYKLTTAPSIEELHLAGVKFQVGLTNNLFDIRFNYKDGILEFPKLKPWDSTELLLRNLVAFEQCTYEEKYISDYVSIMDEFVDSPKDVKLLVAYKIVQNNLAGGDDKLSAMINSLSTGVILDHKNFYYGTLCEDLNKFCSSKWHRSMANLRQNYFNTPWAIISFVAAVVLLILTAVQTICSIISLP